MLLCLEDRVFSMSFISSGLDNPFASSYTWYPEHQGERFDEDIPLRLSILRFLTLCIVQSCIYISPIYLQPKLFPRASGVMDLGGEFTTTALIIPSNPHQQSTHFPLYPLSLSFTLYQGNCSLKKMGSSAENHNLSNF